MFLQLAFLYQNLYSLCYYYNRWITMKNEFLQKTENKEYISKFIYNKVKKDYFDIIPLNFDLDKYNEQVIYENYIKNRDYFDNLYKDVDSNIHLDFEQISAIISDEKYSLIIAGAGTGKTTTMASKVKYLVDIKKVKPEKILVISYTRKAVEELIQRINIDFSIPAKVMTFHSLGYSYIKEIFKGHKCSIADENLKNSIFLEYFQKNIYSNKSVLREFFALFDTKSTCKSWLFSKFFIENFDKYKTYNELFNAYKKFKISEIEDLETYVNKKLEYEYNQEIIKTIKNEFVKSKGEAIIANYLFMHGIDYSYEKVFPELIDGTKVYRPDFTINYDGDDIYIEYFGLSNYKDDNSDRYKKNKEIKINYHKNKNTKFISIDSMSNEKIINTLEESLKNYGFSIKMKSYEEIYNAMLDRNYLSLIYPLKDLFYECIMSIKSSIYRINYVDYCKKYFCTLNKEETIKANMQFHYIDEFYHFYQNKLYGDPINYYFDFPDMIYYATEYMNKVNSKEFNFEYIIIDEYQDITYGNYELAKNIVNNSDFCKIVAVGDDWQSIYSFNGSKIEYVYNFARYFPDSKIFKISKTYRNCQNLVNYSGKFIMKNNFQIKKDLISDKKIEKPVKFVLFKDGFEYLALKELILRIHKEYPSHSILILGRTNENIYRCFDDTDLIDSIDTKVKFIGYEDIDIDAMTIHKSKGLTNDEVIIIGLDKSFPSSHSKYWFNQLFSFNLMQEGVAFPEERRIFYVALTRTKNNVYLLVNENQNSRSPFINELWNVLN